MSDYARPQDIAVAFGDLARRLAALEAGAAVRQYTTATLPAAASVKGAIVFDTTAGKHKGSDGTAWNALY